MELQPPAVDIDLAACAFFLDCDGTLAAIVDHPADARVEPDVIVTLDLLSRRTKGALAVVSGRSIQQLDDMLSPLTLPLAGVHGVERRNSEGKVYRPTIDAEAVGTVAQTLQHFADLNPGIYCEVKASSVALHYRQAPDLEPYALAFMSEVSSHHPAFRLLRGKMVAELSGSHRTKGDAIRDFMNEPPFHGRIPIFAGDDVTDEDAFAVLPRYNGIGIKVGPGDTQASSRVPDLAAMHSWLATIAGSRQPA